MTLINPDFAQALQAMAVELAFLSPQSTSSMGAVVSALEVLMQSPQIKNRGNVQAVIRREHHWAQQVHAGSVSFEADDLARLQESYCQIAEAFTASDAPQKPSAVALEGKSTKPDFENEPVLYVRKTDDIELLNEFCNEGRELLGQIEQGVLVLEEQPNHKEMLNQVFRAFHTFKGGAALLDLSPVKHLAHELESLLSASRNGNLPVDRRVIDLILAGGDALRGFIDLIGQRLAGVEPEQPVCIPTVALITRIRACLNREPELPALPDSDPIPIPLAPIAKAEDLVNFVKLDARKLDMLVDLVGELVIAQSLVVEDPNVRSLPSRTLASQLRQLGRITTDLQQSAMSLRMIPIGSTFKRMARLVRDLSLSQEKQVRLQLLGEETEIDRSMIDELVDPLMHMIRNAVDHGIESPQLRIQNGKSPEGTIKLQAFHRDGGIVISISDDGKGMDENQIRDKAIERQLIAEGDMLNTTEILDLIFQPGFSTAANITEVSGRGVGMDVVRGNIAHLRGRVEVKTTLGEGSEFEIRLPLTLAVIDSMLVRLGDERFILPILSIRESFKPQAGTISKVQGRGELVNIRGKLIPLVRLSEQLGIPSAVIEPTDGVVVVVESRSQLRGILVDALVGKSKLVIKPLGHTFKHVKGMTGCAILGDGHVALILDPDTLGTLQTTKLQPTLLNPAVFN